MLSGDDVRVLGFHLDIEILIVRGESEIDVLVLLGVRALRVSRLDALNRNSLPVVQIPVEGDGDRVGDVCRDAGYLVGRYRALALGSRDPRSDD